MVLLSDEFPHGGCRSLKSIGGSAVTLHIYTEDVDRTFNQAIDAGATIVMSVMILKEMMCSPPNRVIENAELSPGGSVETSANPAHSILINLLSLSYNAASTETPVISCVELFTTTPENPILYLCSIMLKYLLLTTSPVGIVSSTMLAVSVCSCAKNLV
jgi:hypothetical protein